MSSPDRYEDAMESKEGASGGGGDGRTRRVNVCASVRVCVWASGRAKCGPVKGGGIILAGVEKV